MEVRNNVSRASARPNPKTSGEERSVSWDHGKDLWENGEGGVVKDGGIMSK